jgi:hypothetical protein
MKRTPRDMRVAVERVFSDGLISSRPASSAYTDPTKTTISEFMQRWQRDWAVSNVSIKTAER